MNKIGTAAKSVRDVVFGSKTNLTACLYALFVIRIWLGVTFVAHGAQKVVLLFTPDKSPVGMVAGIGFEAHPHLWTGLLIFAELGGGLALFIGFAPRVFAIPIIGVMAVALSTVHKGQGFMSTVGPQMIIVACVAIIIGGGGAWSIWPACQRWYCERKMVDAPPGPPEGSL